MKTYLILSSLALLVAGCNSSGDEASPTTADATTTSAQAQASSGSIRDFPAAVATPTSTTSLTGARDPGVRGGVAGAGDPLPLASTSERKIFLIDQGDFNDAEAPNAGLGPTMNLDSCGGCHSQPAIGGSSPAVNPQIAFATKQGARNTVPSFLSLNGPIREARFVRKPDGTPDGGVHSIFTVTGRVDAPGCNISQPNFAAAVANNNVIFRIPTPVFGAGLMEAIPDSTIVANQAANATAKRAAGIVGRFNRNGNDGTIARFGWKAQNNSLLLFAGEAYNVEMGITNDIFFTERDETASCHFTTAPNSVTDFAAASSEEAVSSIEKFATFMRLLAPPTPSPTEPGGASSISNGQALFTSTGCVLCHTATMQTGNATSAAMKNKPVNLFSDLLLHDMGPGLADGVSQGAAGGRDFRTAPLWGLGKRVFFLHDGRTKDLTQAVLAHSSNGSEASITVTRFNMLVGSQQQDLLNFLRSL
jgi:CxxC motif-containing protein (DUF1111 family)